MDVLVDVSFKLFKMLTKLIRKGNFYWNWAQLKQAGPINVDSQDLKIFNLCFDCWAETQGSLEMNVQMVRRYHLLKIFAPERFKLLQECIELYPDMEINAEILCNICPEGSLGSNVQQTYTLQEWRDFSYWPPLQEAKVLLVLGRKEQTLAIVQNMAKTYRAPQNEINQLIERLEKGDEEEDVEMPIWSRLIRQLSKKKVRNEYFSNLLHNLPVGLSSSSIDFPYGVLG